jgi:hypothetical protein
MHAAAAGISGLRCHRAHCRRLARPASAQER